MDFFLAPPMTLKRKRAVESDCTSVFLVILLAIMTILLGLFIFSLPLLSWWFNDYMGQGAQLCSANPAEIVCGNGANYIELATALGRYKSNGELWGCGCEEGIFGDWACPIGEANIFSIGLFISTAPGTGLMAALSSWPIAAMWLYGSGTVTTNKNWIRLSLFLFQFFFGMFLINTACVYTDWHTFSVTAFILAELAHYTLLAVSLGCCSSRSAKLISGAATIGIISVVLGFLVAQGYLPIATGWLKYHAFWLGECCGLMCAFSIAPILLVYQEQDEVSEDQRHRPMVPILA